MKLPLSLLSRRAAGKFFALLVLLLWPTAEAMFAGPVACVESRPICAGKSSSNSTWAPSDIALRIKRPALHCHFSQIVETAEPNRQPISQASESPGTFRAFLVWRQRYAHLALCNMTLCHGSCIAYGDGCLARAQNPILPQLLQVSFSSCRPNMRPKSPVTEGCH